MNRRVLLLVWTGALPCSASAARLDLAVAGPGGSLPPGTLRLDIVWSMNTTDTAAYDLDGFDARFNVRYPPLAGEIRVTGVSTLPGWDTQVTEGVGDHFDEFFFFSTLDPTYQGVSGNGSAFTTVIGSIFLSVEGDVSGTEITLRHNDVADPLPSPHDGSQDWQLRWQEPVTGPFEFDIGLGNPGDGTGNWPYHGFETYNPLVIPEPGVCGVLLLGALVGLRVRRKR